MPPCTEPEDFSCPSYLPFGFLASSSPYSYKRLLNLLLQAAVLMIWHFPHHRFVELTDNLAAAQAADLAAF